MFLYLVTTQGSSTSHILQFDFVNLDVTFFLISVTVCTLFVDYILSCSSDSLATRSMFVLID